MPSLLVNASETGLLRGFLLRQVRFVVVGGHAVIFHGYLRAAKDLDLFVAIDGENPSNVVDALSSVGIVSPALSPQRLSLPNQQIRINGHLHIELLTSVSGLTFANAYASCVHAQVGELKVPVLSLHHLLQSKRALSRPQDIEDISALERNAHGL